MSKLMEDLQGVLYIKTVIEKMLRFFVIPLLLIFQPLDKNITVTFYF